MNSNFPDRLRRRSKNPSLKRPGRFIRRPTAPGSERGMRQQKPRTRRGKGSVLVNEHDREDAGGLGWVGRIFRPELHVSVVRVDLPKELPAGKREVAKIVLAMWVI